jgi:hypothetical protein
MVVVEVMVRFEDCFREIPGVLSKASAVHA